MNRQRLLQGIKRTLLVAFPLLALWLLARYAQRVDWDQVLRILLSYGPAPLTAALALAALSYGFYCTYDLAARRYTGHSVRARRVAVITFVTYAVSLNLGAIIGGAGFRFRLYSRAGLKTAVISRIVGFSVSTNWFGYVAVMGTLLATQAIVWPARWTPDPTLLRLLGIGLLLAIAAYAALCARWHDRQWEVRGHVIVLPSARLALVQVLLATANWLTIAGIVYVLLPGPVPYTMVLASLLLSGIAAAVIHVPAGLGVMEAVFVAMLSRYMPEERILAALIAFRAVYYLLPLALATLAYFALELGDRRKRPRD